jgi:hypothetical protein
MGDIAGLTLRVGAAAAPENCVRLRIGGDAGAVSAKDQALFL